MVWNQLFHRSPGGSTRRWIRISEAKMKKKWTKQYLKGPITLFDFSQDDDAADAVLDETEGGWKVSDDRVIGGLSHGSINLISSSQQHIEYELEQQRTDPIKKNGTSANVSNNSEETFRPFLRWEGKLDTRIGENSTVDRSGFVAIKSPSFNGAATFSGLPYNAIEVTCRTTVKRDFMFNIEISTLMPGVELYQNLLSIPPYTETMRTENANMRRITQDGFLRIISPLSEFEFFTGSNRDLKQNLMSGVELDGVGLTLMDGLDGDFSLDLAQIRLINYFEGEILGEEDADAPY